MKAKVSNDPVLTNIAKQSTSGHFLVDCKVKAHNEEEGTYICKSMRDDATAVLTTSNHGTVEVKSTNGFAVFTQVELNNYTKLFERARD